MPAVGPAGLAEQSWWPGARHTQHPSRDPIYLADRVVDWLAVHHHIAPLLEKTGSWPTVGTPAWCALPDDDPAKLAAIYAAARHEALRIAMMQEAAEQASKAVSAAVREQGGSWGEIGRRIRRHTEFETEHPWARRRNGR
jgi:Protein of unknown function (DUF2742)